MFFVSAIEKSIKLYTFAHENITNVSYDRFKTH